MEMGLRHKYDLILFFALFLFSMGQPARLFEIADRDRNRNV